MKSSRLAAESARYLAPMAVLRVKEVRKRERAPRDHDRVNDLSVEEQAHVLAALRVVKIRCGQWSDVASSLQISLKAVGKLSAGASKLTAGLALRIARLVGVPTEDVLSGAFPRPGSCPMCGR